MAATLRVIDNQTPSGFRQLVPSGRGEVNLNGGFTELQGATFFYPGGEEHQLFVDDEPLPGKRVNGYEGWVWSPRFYAGTVRAELILKGESTGQRYLLDVAPNPKKLGQADFQRLIQDILDVDPTLLIGNEPATHGSAGSDHIEDPDLQYAYLFQYGEPLLAALRAIETRPRRTLCSNRITVPLSRVRRVDAYTALSIARNGSFEVIRASDGSGSASADFQNLRFNVPFSIESLDSPATRCIAALVSAVRRRADVVYRALEQQVAHEADSDVRTGLGNRWPRRRAFLDNLIDGLRSAMSRDPLQSASRIEITAAGLTAVAADPTYARAQRLAWKILRPGVPSSAADSWTWMSPTWEIYESWCFIKLGELLRRLLPNLTWVNTAAARKTGVACVEGIGSDVRIRLQSQLTFRYALHSPNPSAFQSISKELRPDLVLTVESSGTRRWIVLDAKYSQSRSRVLDAMHSAHVYHDALRWYGTPPYRSLLLVPAAAEDVAWLLDKNFKSDHGVGVTLFSSADENQDIIFSEILNLVTTCGGDTRGQS